MESREASLAATWVAFEQLSAELTVYLQTSESEFLHLISAFAACGNMAEDVQRATARLAALGTTESDRESLAIRDSMLEGCRVFKAFLDQVQAVGRELELISQEAKGVLRASNLLREDFIPLTHIAFHLRLESSRLSQEYTGSVMKGYEEMIEVLGDMKQAGESQDRTLVAILEKLSGAERTAERAFNSYSAEATASQERILDHLLLLTPPDLEQSQREAAALHAVIAASIGEAVEVLQEHGAIRQRTEHILKALDAVRGDAEMDPGSTLLLERQQARDVLEQIVSVGSGLKRALHAVIASAQGLDSDSAGRAAAEAQVNNFEQAVDQLAGLTGGVARLLARGMTIGNLVLTQIDPIGQLLRGDDAQLGALARSMRRLKRLALNVLVSADKMPSAQGIRVLSAWTSEAAERTLKLAKELEQQFAQLDTTLKSNVVAITGVVQGVQSCRIGLLIPRSDENLRKSRRLEYDEVCHLQDKARALQEKTEGLLQSPRFVEEGSRLLKDLDVIFDSLLALYSKPELKVGAASTATALRDSLKPPGMAWMTGIP